VTGSLVLPHYLKYVNRRLLLTISTLLYGAATVIFGFLDYFDKQNFILIGLGMRAIQGLTCAAIFTTGKKLLPQPTRYSLCSTKGLSSTPSIPSSRPR
jgi:MFS family permease